VHAASRSSAVIYTARRPDDSILHQVVAEGLDDFLADGAASGHRVPLFIERTFRDYLLCGDPAAGFVRVHCADCGEDRVVAFSCKRRGVCSSCGGRRMADTAANLVEFVFPHIGVRQWVLSVPFALRYRLAYDRSLLTPVLGAFIRAVFCSHRRRLRERYGNGIGHARCGAVTFVQRFGGALNLNVHFHCLVLEGGYEVPRSASGPIDFLSLPAPTDDDVRGVLADAAGRIGRQLTSRGLGEDSDASEADASSRGDPLLAALYAASVQGLVATGARAGAPTLRIGRRPGSQGVSEGTLPNLCAVGHGLSLHAGVYVPGTDRRRLERICRYTARPALAEGRLRRLADGRISYRMQHPWRDGSTHVVMEPSELIAKLAALIPPPRQHQCRYHGILAPSAAWRGYVVPKAERAGDAPRQASCGAVAATPPCESRYRPWAVLMRRVFALDVLECPRCGGRMTVVAAGLVGRAGIALVPGLGLKGRAPPGGASVVRGAT